MSLPPTSDRNQILPFKISEFQDWKRLLDIYLGTSQLEQYTGLNSRGIFSWYVPITTHLSLDISLHA